ncbi:MAG TPA: hypothetical protein VK134_01865, partial [Ktedonobacteraceae bacterium]|nr:hypothetical protein [Ktedonobacteraceae bacterium]
IFPRQHPPLFHHLVLTGVIAKGIPIAHNERLETIFGNNQWWQREVLDYLTAINNGQMQPDALKPDLLEPFD